MQLFNYPKTQFSNIPCGRILDVLKDITNKIEIQSNFSIHHPDYQPLAIPSEAVERFQRMPEQMQKKYLSLHLRSFIYGIYYNGLMKKTLALTKETKVSPLDLENNTFLGVDLGFYQQLHESNNGKGYFDSGWSVIKQESDGALIVNKGELRLHIEPDQHLPISQQSAIVGDSVQILLPKNLLQNGFYIAVGNAGANHSAIEQSVIVRTYFNLTPEGAIGVMGSLTRQLNAMTIPFHFKVLYNPKDYQRYDSGVLYFDKRDYEVVGDVLKTVYREYQSHFQVETPLFTLEIAPGLGLAEEPDQKFVKQESFGMNRCQIVANGLLAAWYKGDDSSEGKMKAVIEQFSQLEINLQRVYLNANSEDIYKQLEIKF